MTHQTPDIKDLSIDDVLSSDLLCDFESTVQEMGAVLGIQEMTSDILWDEMMSLEKRLGMGREILSWSKSCVEKDVFLRGLLHDYRRKLEALDPYIRLLYWHVRDHQGAGKAASTDPSQVLERGGNRYIFKPAPGEHNDPEETTAFGVDGNPLDANHHWNQS